MTPLGRGVLVVLLALLGVVALGAAGPGARRGRGGPGGGVVGPAAGVGRCARCALEATHAVVRNGVRAGWSIIQWSPQRRVTVRWCRWHATVEAVLRNFVQREEDARLSR
jgi:hypothetical protein